MTQFRAQPLHVRAEIVAHERLVRLREAYGEEYRERLQAVKKKQKEKDAAKRSVQGQALAGMGIGGL